MPRTWLSQGCSHSSRTATGKLHPDTTITNECLDRMHRGTRMSIPVLPFPIARGTTRGIEHVSSIRRVSGNDFDTGVGSGCLARSPDNNMTQAKKRWLGRRLVRCLPTCDRAKASSTVHRRKQRAIIEVETHLARRPLEDGEGQDTHPNHIKMFTCHTQEGGQRAARSALATRLW